MSTHPDIRVSVFIATSLDGFIARVDGSIDWLVNAEVFPEGEDFGYKAFYDSVDCLIMGRGCLETAASFSEWPYEGKRVVVLSTTRSTSPPAVDGKIEFHTGPPGAVLETLAEQGFRHAYLDGGRTVQSFLNHGLVTSLTITRIPVLIGEGRPLFGTVPGDIPLRHISTRSFPNGFVSSTYEVCASLVSPARRGENG